MKALAKMVTIGMAVLAAVVLISIPQAFAAKAAFDEPPHVPGEPQGISTDAVGIKLYGDVVIKFTNFLDYYPSDEFSDFEVVAHLRKGNEDETFYAAGGPVIVTDPTNIILVISDALEDQVLSHFFNGEEGLCAVVKRADNIDRGPDACAFPPNTPDATGCDGFFFDTMSIEVAVSSCD